MIARQVLTERRALPRRAALTQVATDRRVYEIDRVLANADLIHASAATVVAQWDKTAGPDLACAGPDGHPQGSCRPSTSAYPGAFLHGRDHRYRVQQHSSLVTFWRCACREFHSGRSGGMFVLVKDAAEAATSVDVQVGEPVRVGDRFG